MTALPEQADASGQQLLEQQPPAESAAAAAAAGERQPLSSGAGGGSYEATATGLMGHSSESLSGSAVEMRRQGSFEQRRQFQASREETWRRAMFSVESWRSPRNVFFLCMLVLTLMVPPIFIICVELRSLYVMFAYTSLPCDQNLAFWLVVRNILTWLAPKMPAPNDPDEERATRQRSTARIAATFCTVWLIIGFYATTQAVTCPLTSPVLFEWVRFLAIFGILVHVLNIFLPFVLIFGAMLYQNLVSRGWLKSPNAASDKAIERMEAVEFDSEAFKGDSSAAVPAECCCCMEEFGEQKQIVRTPCVHYFHHECLKEWLKVAKTCPLCRSDLDKGEEPSPV